MMNWEELPAPWRLAIAGAGIGGIFALAATAAGLNPKWSIGIVTVSSGICALGSLSSPNNPNKGNSSNSQFLLSAAVEIPDETPSDQELEHLHRIDELESIKANIRLKMTASNQEYIAYLLATNNNADELRKLSDDLPTPVKTAAPQRVAPRVVQQPEPAGYSLYSPPEYSIRDVWSEAVSATDDLSETELELATYPVPDTEYYHMVDSGQKTRSKSFDPNNSKDVNGFFS